MDRRDKSRAEWERELRDVQDGVTPGGWLRADQIMAQKLSASPAPIRSSASLIGFAVSFVLIGIGLGIFSSQTSNKIAFGTAAVVVGCCIGIAAFVWNRKAS